jgi:hypothetical protein
MFTLSAGKEDQRQALRSLLVGQLASERARRTRQGFLFVLASAGIAVWVAATWPLVLNDALRTVALYAWGLLFVATLFAVFFEWFWHRRSKQALDALTSTASSDTAQQCSPRKASGE